MLYKLRVLVLLSFFLMPRLTSTKEVTLYYYDFRDFNESLLKSLRFILYYTFYASLRSFFIV
jgi:hypothetical protein